MKRRSFVILATGAILLATALAAAAAVAVFVSGGGQGAASVGTPIPLELSPGVVPGAGALYAGNSGDVVVDITNDNPVPVEIFVIVQDGDISTNKRTCDPAWFTYEGQSGPWIIPAQTTETFTLAGALSLSEDAGEACNGASVDIDLFADGVLVLPSTEE